MDACVNQGLAGLHKNNLAALRNATTIGKSRWFFLPVKKNFYTKGYFF
jgi:hypothetical protein